MKLSAYTAISHPFQDQLDQRLKHVVFGTRRGHWCVLDAETVCRLSRQEVSCLPEEIISDLVRNEILIDEGEDEFKTIVERNDEARRRQTTLYEVIHPTGYCQLGCIYCGQHHEQGLMCAGDQDLLLNRIETRLRQGCWERLVVGWFGGEPLSGLPVIRRLTPQLRSIAAENGCQYQAKMVTNGLALRGVVARELIEDLRVKRIEVTLDGSPPFHDQRRSTKQGDATFSRIFANILRFAQSDYDTALVIRCNVDLSIPKTCPSRRLHRGVLSVIAAVMNHSTGMRSASPRPAMPR